MNEAESAYIAYLEQRILRSSPEAFGRSIIQESQWPMETPERLFEMMAEIAACMRRFPQFSISEAVEHLKTQGIIRLVESDREGQLAAVRITFAMCGWISMLYNPILTHLHEADGVYIDGQGAISFLASTQSVNNMCRPLSEVLRGFGDIVPAPIEDCGMNQVSHGSGDSFLVSHLNAATLCHTGEIEIIWVESVSSHLEFNSLERKLLLFCLPCFCQINLAAKTASNA